MWAPNASIRILVAMSILKEGIGCSDEELLDVCEFDQMARKALGLEMLDDKLPSIDTYHPHTRRKDTIQRLVQTSPPDIPLLHVNESAQIGAIPNNNK